MNKLEELAIQVRAAWYRYTLEQKTFGIDSDQERDAFDNFENKEHDLLDFILSENFEEEIKNEIK